jgi:hypothetical protein
MVNFNTASNMRLIQQINDQIKALNIPSAIQSAQAAITNQQNSGTTNSNSTVNPSLYSFYNGQSASPGNSSSQMFYQMMQTMQMMMSQMMGGNSASNYGTTTSTNQSLTGTDSTSEDLSSVYGNTVSDPYLDSEDSTTSTSSDTSSTDSELNNLNSLTSDPFINGYNTSSSTTDSNPLSSELNSETNSLLTEDMNKVNGTDIDVSKTLKNISELDNLTKHFLQ